MRDYSTFDTVANALESIKPVTKLRIRTTTVLQLPTGTFELFEYELLLLNAVVVAGLTFGKLVSVEHEPTTLVTVDSIE